MESETFVTDTNWTVPDGVTTLDIELEAAAADDSNAGDGGRVEGSVAVAPGETIYVRMRAGSASYDGGEGVTLHRGGTDRSDVVAAAGGGGDSGQGDVPGGDGGGLEGEDGGQGTSSFDTAGGEGGTQTEAGSGAGDGADGDGYLGADGIGRDGGSGWYGGGAGDTSTTQGDSGGGGGASSYVDGLDTVHANEQGTSPRSYGDGAVARIEWEAEPEQVSSLSGSQSGNDVTVTWDGDVRDGAYRLRRGSGLPVDETDTLVATITSGSSHSITDTPGFGGYHYAVERADPGGETIDISDPTQEIVFPVPAPTGLEAADVRDTEVDLVWTDNADGEVPYRIDARIEDDGDWEEAGSTEAGAESGTATGLLNGQLYGVRVVAVAPGDEAVDLSWNVGPGETLGVASGETHTFGKPFVNAGGVETSGTVQPDDTVTE